MYNLLMHIHKLIIRGYITAYFISDRISSLRSHIGSRRSREPICDQGLDMQSDIKYAVIYSLYRISAHAIDSMLCDTNVVYNVCIAQYVTELSCDWSVEALAALT